MNINTQNSYFVKISYSLSPYPANFSHYASVFSDFRFRAQCGNLSPVVDAVVYPRWNSRIARRLTEYL